MAALSAKMLKIEEASRKKDEQTSQFITATRDALEQKMGHHTEKREAYITDLKTKLKVLYFGFDFFFCSGYYFFVSIVFRIISRMLKRPACHWNNKLMRFDRQLMKN